MRLSKREFVDKINAIKETRELVSKVNKLLREAKDNVRNDFANAASLMITHEDDLIETIAIMFEDRYSNWISWWINECDFGKIHPEVYDNEDNILRVLDSPEALYDFLMEEIKDVKEH